MLYNYGRCYSCTLNADGARVDQEVLRALDYAHQRWSGCTLCLRIRMHYGNWK
jgi:hypothetical protein